MAWSARALSQRVLSKLEPLNSSDQLRTSTLVGGGRRRGSTDRTPGLDRGGRGQGRARSRTAGGVGVLLRVAGHGQPRRARACATIRRPERTAIRVVPARARRLSMNVAATL